MISVSVLLGSHTLLRLARNSSRSVRPADFWIPALLGAIICGSYVVFALAGYRIRDDEVVGIPAWLAWAVVALMTAAGVFVLVKLADAGY